MCAKLYFVFAMFASAVNGDERKWTRQCEYSPNEVTLTWIPCKDGPFNIKFFVPPRSWKAGMEDSLHLLFEVKSTRKKFTMTLSEGGDDPSSTTNFTIIPVTSIRIGWNELNLTWLGTDILTNVWTLYFNEFETQFSIEHHDEIEVVAEGMSLFINCRTESRLYIFSPSSRTYKVSFMWEENAAQPIFAYIPSTDLRLTTHPWGRLLNLCQQNDTSKSNVFYLMRACPLGQRDAEEGSSDSTSIYVSATNLEEENYIAVGKFRFMEINVTYLGEKERLFKTSHQRLVPVTYQEIFPGNTSTFPRPENETVCPINPVVALTIVTVALVISIFFLAFVIIYFYIT